MYDLHAHILPGVDDGPRTADVTLEMARVAAEYGTKTILATPHRKDVTEESSVGHIRNLIARMNAQIQGQGTKLSLVLGMENHLDIDLPDEIAAGRALPMNGTQYILIEMPFFGSPNWIEATLAKVQSQGLTPVLAHPERIEAFADDPGLLVKLVKQGMLSQITAGSPLGYWGEDVKQFTNYLLKRRLVHIIASDTHFPEHPRSPELLPGVEAASRIVGEEAAQAMVVDTPRAILEGKTVEVEPPRAAR